MTLLIPLLVIICFYLHNRLKRERKSTKKTTKNESQLEEDKLKKRVRDPGVVDVVVVAVVVGHGVT